MLRVDLNTMTTSPADSSLAFGTPELVPSSQSIASSEAPLSHLAPRLPTQYFADFDPISPLDVVDPTWPTSSAAPRVVASTSASIPHTSLAAPTPIVTLPVPNSLQLHSKASPLVPYKGRKRGRKPKDAVAEEVVQLDPAEEEARKADALERNRIAASKSRRKKKEKVFEMESGESRVAANPTFARLSSLTTPLRFTAITSLSTTNESLQADCRILQMEMLELRRLVTSLHPVEAGCSCTHVVGYLAREAAGGGIPTIDRLAGETLTRDYPAFKDLIGKEPTEHKFVEAEEPVKVEKKRKPVVEDTFVERAPIPIKRRKA